MTEHTYSRGVPSWQNVGQLLRQAVRRFVVGLLAFVPALRSLCQDQVPVATPIGKTDRHNRVILQGTVLAVNHDKAVVRSSGRISVLALPDCSHIWKGAWGMGPVELGDELTAVLSDQPSRSRQPLTATRLWLNVENRRGIITRLRNEGECLRFTLSGGVGKQPTSK